MSSPWASGARLAAEALKTEDRDKSAKFDELHALMKRLSPRTEERMQLLWAEFVFQVIGKGRVDERDLCSLMQMLLDHLLTANREVHDD